MIDYSEICCPCTHKSNLKKVQNGFVCEKEHCPHFKEQNAFLSKDATPVLISELVTDTVFEYAKLRGAVKRQENSFLLRLRKVLVTENKLTIKNCSTFLSEAKSLNQNPKILIIGGGEIGSGARELYRSEAKITCGDIYLSEYTDMICDGHYLPFKDSSFDAVWIQAVLEHVADPPKVVDEIYRVLKSKGLIYSEIPFLQHVHEGAYDFTRYTVVGHRYLFKSFEKLSLGPLRSAEDTLSWSLRYFCWGLTRSKTLARCVGIISSLILKPLSTILPKSSSYDSTTGSFFLGRKSASTITQREALSSYKGMQ